MIRYKLKCDNCKKSFDSWFSSSLEFEKLKNKKFLNCHFCDSNNISKTLMAPNIVSSRQKKLDNVQSIISQEHMKMEKNVLGMLEYMLLKE